MSRERACVFAAPWLAVAVTACISPGAAIFVAGAAVVANGIIALTIEI